MSEAMRGRKRVRGEEAIDSDVSAIPGNRPIVEKEFNSKRAQNPSVNAGMQIMHDSMSFEVGEEVVLTLADTDVVKRDQYGRIVSVNDSDDALENVNFAEYERKEDRDRRLKRLHQPIYSGYDDEEFEENGMPGKKRGILSQYDQEQKRGAKMVIGGNGIVMNLTNPANITKNTLLQEKKAAYQSLHTEYKTGSDFVDPSEIKFKKIKKSDKHKKQREKSPERPQENNKNDSTNNGAEEDYDMSKILEDDSNDIVLKETMHGTISDLPKKKEEVEDKKPILSSLISKKRRLNLFSAQLAKASVQSVVYDDEDPDLALAMSRARQSAIAARRKDPSAMEEEDDSPQIQISSRQKDDEDEDFGAKVAREMALRASKVIVNKDHGNAESKVDEGISYEEEMDVEGRRSDGKLVFNSTTEFASRLQARLTDRARQASELAMREMERQVVGNDSASTIEKPTEISAMNDHNMSYKSHNEHEKEEENTEEIGKNNEEILDDDFIMDIEEDEDSDSDDDENEQDAEEDEQLAFLHKQPLFSKGLGATLALLKDSGELNKPKLQAGRARDVRDKDDNVNDNSNIRLEYRDEHGNILTKKEEFRRLSYHFHGQGPGKKKLEKRLKAQKALMRAGLPKAGVLDGTAGTMKSLNRALEATGRSHVMLQGGVTADPETITALAQEMMKKKEKKEKKKEKDSIKK